MASNKCDLHNEKKNKFCREANCWERVCSLCVRQRHCGHSVVDYVLVVSEVKAERDKHAKSKGKQLLEIKKALTYLEKVYKGVKDEKTRIQEFERKLRTLVDVQMKALGDAITLQQDRTQKVLNKTVESINAKRLELGKVMAVIENVAEKIVINGDGYSIRKFFQICAHNCSVRLEERVREVEKEFGRLQEIGRKLSSYDIASIIGNNLLKSFLASQSIEISSNFSRIDKTIIERPPSHNRSTGDTIMKLLRNSPLKTVRKFTPERAETETRLEALKKSLKDASFRLSEKKSDLETLDTLIESKNKDIEIQESIKEKLARENNKLREYLEEQNKTLAKSARKLCVSCTPRSQDICLIGLKRPCMTPGANSVSKEGRMFNFDTKQGSVSSLLIA